MTYETLLAKAPPHDTDDFIEYLRKNNVVVYDESGWIIIENCKYHRPDRPWYTAFPTDWTETCTFMLPDRFHELTWLKKPTNKQTIKRFHIHMYQAD